MKRNFSQHFEIIYNAFSKAETLQRRRPSNASLGRLLGHPSDGKVKAWKSGQWPSAEDLWRLEKQFGFSLRWLVTGEGDPYGQEGGTAAASADDSDEGVQALQARMQEMERELAEERRLNRQLTARLLVDGVGDKGVASSTGKAGEGRG